MYVNVNVESHQVVEVPEGLTVEALGSYRRGKADSGDCDVLLTHDDGVRCTSVPQMFLNTRVNNGRAFTLCNCCVHPTVIVGRFLSTCCQVFPVHQAASN